MVLPSATDSQQPVGTHQAGGPGSQPPMPSMGRSRLRMWVPDWADAPIEETVGSGGVRQYQVASLSFQLARGLVPGLLCR